MALVQKKRKDLSLKEKLDILQQYDKLPKMGQRNAALQLNISQPLLCKILKNREAIESGAKQNENLNCKRNRSGKDNQVESALKVWYADVCEQNAQINGPLIRMKAQELAKKMGKDDFVATEGWIYRWKKRANIASSKRTRSEQTFADFSTAEKWMEDKWPTIISEFSPSNVYSAGETGLYYRALPEHTYLFENDTAGDDCTAAFKEHVTILCCVNMAGEKERLLAIGKNKAPLSLTAINALPVDYYSNSNAWMTPSIFNEWLMKWDNALDRDVVLLIDNCPAHVVNTSLKHIKIVFLPADMTSLLLSCDRGIARMLKAYYRREMRMRIAENIQDSQKQMTAGDLAKKANFIDCLHLLAMSWHQLSASAVQNCFRQVGFLKENKEVVDAVPPDMTASDFEVWMAIDLCIQVSAVEADADQWLENESGQSEGTSDTHETDKPPTTAEMRQALQLLRRGVQCKAVEFQKHYEYESFINDLLRKQ